MANTPMVAPGLIPIKASPLDQNGAAMYNFLGGSVDINSNITLTPAYTGKVLLVNSASNVTLTLSASLPRGFNVTIIQVGAGQAICAAGAGATLNGAFTSTAAQYAMIGLYAIADGALVLTGNGV